MAQRLPVPPFAAGIACQKGLSRCWVRSSRLQVNVTSGSDARSGAPCVEGFAAESTLRCRPDEMATYQRRSGSGSQIVHS